VTEPDEDFAAMFEASVKAKRFEKGETLEGKIVAIGPEVAFVDVGGKGEATIEIDELKDADGHLEVAVGDRIRAMVVSTEGGLTLSRRLARGAATDRQTQLKGMAQTMLDQIEGINQEEVATKILALQTSLQASYQTTSMLYQTTLTKFLPM